MAGFGKKKKITEYLYTKLSILVILIILVILVTAVSKRFTVERDMAQREMDSQKAKQELQERKKILEERVEYLSGERGIEEEIRKHFNVAKPGEKVIVLVGDDGDGIVKETITPAVEDIPWYKFWGLQ